MVHYADDNYYRCLCGTHVHKGTFILAIIGIIFNFPMLVSFYGSGSAWYFGLAAGSNIVSLICYICLLIGNRKEIPALYLPFLILNTIIIVLIVLFAIALFVLGVLIIKGNADIVHVDVDSQADLQTALDIVGGFTIGAGVLYLIAALIQFYFLWVIYRGYRYLKDVLLHPSSNLPHTHQVHVHHVH